MFVLIIGGSVLLWFLLQPAPRRVALKPIARPSQAAPIAPPSQRPQQSTVPPPSVTAQELESLPPELASMVAKLPERSPDELQRQWLNTIKTIDRVGASRAAPYIIFRNAIGVEWARRLETAKRDPGQFAWPTTKANVGKNGLQSGDWHLTGMLSYLGYRVGVTNGESDGVRRQILDACFGYVLPPINGLAYMDDWGSSASTTRLRKVANELAAFVRNAKRKRSVNLANAVADWEADLDYLYRCYYVGRFRFAWPRLD